MLLDEGVDVDRFGNEQLSRLRKIDFGSVIVDELVPVTVDDDLDTRFERRSASIFQDATYTAITQQNDTSDWINSDNLDEDFEHFRVETGTVIAK